MTSRVLWVLISTAMFCASAVSVVSCRPVEKGPEVTWNDTLRLPPMKGDSVNIGVAGAFAGMAGDRLMIAGGANFPDGFPWTGAKKVWHRDLYAYDLTSGEWTVYPDFLPQPMGYGVSVTLPEGVMLIGGNNADGGIDSVYMLSAADGHPQLRGDVFPALPFALSNGAGAMVDGKVFVAGGIQGKDDGESASHAFVMLDLDSKDEGWQVLEPWPGPTLGFSVAAAADGRFYLFGGRDFGPDRDITVSTAGFAYDPASGEWSVLEGEFPVMAATAVTLGDDIWFFGGVEEILPTAPDHPGFSRTLRRYTPATGEIAVVDEAPAPLTVTTTAVMLPDSTVAIASGEERPGVRTPLVLRCKINQ
ncbi:hypothetical protein [uncultured Muribaculum sp.]|uniref:hypothetical protein n=1 Tax=uncultured Muribaculum sp. TaxID=1918613 RepID=UPI0025D2FB2D|nr:hypothetical protein [uncultured Muribaculum sp.]